MMDETFKWATENGWVIPFIIYLLLKDVVPKIYPDVMKRLGDDHTDDLRREDRLYTMLEAVTVSNIELKLVIHDMRDFVKQLSLGLDEINKRVTELSRASIRRENEDK